MKWEGLLLQRKRLSFFRLNGEEVYSSEWCQSQQMNRKHAYVCPYPPSTILCLLSLFHSLFTLSSKKNFSYFGTRERGMDGIYGVIYFTLNKYLVPLQDRSQSTARVQCLSLNITTRKIKDGIKQTKCTTAYMKRCFPPKTRPYNERKV